MTPNPTDITPEEAIDDFLNARGSINVHGSIYYNIEHEELAALIAQREAAVRESALEAAFSATRPSHELAGEFNLGVSAAITAIRTME